MKVILNEDVKKLGKKGDVVEVAEGYGRNYLIPRGLAVQATESNIAILKDRKKALKNKYEAELREAKAKADKINGKKVIMKAKAGDKDRLFGSVTSKDIAEAIKKQYKLNIDKRKIELDKPIRDLGSYKVGVKIHTEVSAVVNIEVVKE
ncbi:MAG: large subunit ribosomal protein [Thermosediminibacterales bacterium]|nr:large subunit ribosomal protein [Thermosediminibacterales bacterium]MDK2836413.1 large subunit ribosomal protein [Thermosediminibacterales bacterium]